MNWPLSVVTSSPHFLHRQWRMSSLLAGQRQRPLRSIRRPLIRTALETLSYGLGWAPQRARRKESQSHLHTFLPTWKRPASFLGLIVFLDAQEEGLPGDFLLLPLLPFPVSQDSEHPLQCLTPMITGFLPPLLQKVAHIASWEHLPHFKMTTIQRANKWSQPSHISLGPDLLCLQPNVFIKVSFRCLFSGGS